MAANLPGKCCGEGHIHTGTPKGSIQTFAGSAFPQSPLHVEFIPLTDLFASL
jgi:hypothetical protein